MSIQLKQTFYLCYGKRFFDAISAGLALLVLSPVLLIIALAVKWHSPGPVLFVQERAGRLGKPFKLYKFRSMCDDAEQKGLGITSSDDPRITRLGHFLRKTKLDELPQLFNVVTGTIALVGPRPEILYYVAQKKSDYDWILKIRPGITDEATIAFRHEQDILARYSDKERAYVDVILPQKVVLYRQYMERITFMRDIKIIFLTLFRIVFSVV